MTDDLDDLKAAMQAMTPKPDDARKRANLALAQKNFARLQETDAAARLTSDARNTGWFRGVTAMFQSISTKTALTATTALFAVGLVIYLPVFPMGPQFETPFAEDAASGIDAPVLALEQPEPRPTPQAAEAPQAIAGFKDDAQAGMMADTASLARPQMQRSKRSVKYPAPHESTGVQQFTAENTETFPDADTNPIKVTSEAPVSTFSIDVDTASYSFVRNAILNGQLPPKDAVRIEEMVNYFPYSYAPPATDDTPFATHVSTFQTPWNSDTQIVRIGLQGQMPDMAERPPLNLVFLIDTSGSMKDAKKLPLLKQSFALMLTQLRPDDSVAIVTYAGSSGQVLEPTKATDKATIFAALDALDAGGATAGQAGLQQAYAVADGMRAEGEISRVILATDGDFNVGISSPKALEEFISTKRDSGTYLSVLGFGRGNLDDATMQALAQNGNGQAAYIDTLNEAQKVLVDQLSGALFPIANDVKIQVEFNPSQIAEYRLIGYETRLLNREDFNNDKVDAGDIGAGHSVTALYEVTPVGSKARLTDPLRYGDAPSGSAQGEMGYLKLRYKSPGTDESQLIETRLPDVATADDEARFATAIAGFGQLLKDDRFLGEWGWTDAITLANEAKGADPFGYRAEAIQLMRLAKTLQGQE
ncbi:MAG: VWA domain-containing protein [Shimia thalassica]|uniref:vWA domain-containing protein n=1 Tax=Shimia thalassica TaxID=1715693 RepID=UPI00329A2003